MPKAVRFDQYGGLDVLQVAEVERPTPLQGDVLVRVKAAGSTVEEAYGQVDRLRVLSARLWTPRAHLSHFVACSCATAGAPD